MKIIFEATDYGRGPRKLFIGDGPLNWVSLEEYIEQHPDILEMLNEAIASSELPELPEIHWLNEPHNNS